MILEAFAEYLHAADPKEPATDVLARWLKERLSSPAVTNVDRVLHCEISISASRSSGRASLDSADRDFIFTGSSQSGKRLLKSLYEYCQSYEQHKWARFVHNVKASDFT